MKKLLLATTCLFVFLALNGCMLPIPIPGSIDTSPIVVGRVIDQQTKEPLQGVEVAFKDEVDSNKLRLKALTQVDGTFVLGPEKHNYAVIVVTPDPVFYLPSPEGYAWFLEFNKRLYVTKTIDLRYIYEQRKNNKFEIGDVELVSIKGK
jgi:hypothetical protein